MPSADDYFDQIKSEVADMTNTGGRPAGAVTAAVFLKQFAGGLPWAHLDIAGVAHFEKEHAGFAAGATGFGVAMTMEFLKRRFGKARPGAGKSERAPRRTRV
jgi:leucyl aminopeptidase